MGNPPPHVLLLRGVLPLPEPNFAGAAASGSCYLRARKCRYLHTHLHACMCIHVYASMRLCDNAYYTHSLTQKTFEPLVLIDDEAQIYHDVQPRVCVWRYVIRRAMCVENQHEAALAATRHTVAAMDETHSRHLRQLQVCVFSCDWTQLYTHMPSSCHPASRNHVCTHCLRLTCVI